MSAIEELAKVLRAHAVTAQGVQSAVRIAAVLHAVAVALEQSGVVLPASVA